MAIYCEKCGTKLEDDARFCTACGAPVRINIKAEKEKAKPTKTAKTEKKTEPKSEKKTKKHMPFINKLLLVILAAEIVVCLIWYPGILTKKKNGPSEIFGDPSNSAALNITPVDGLTIKAPAGALNDDTVFTVTPGEEYNEKLAALDKNLQDNGGYLLAAYDINAGLEEGIHLPGEYEVTIDLNKAGIPEDLYDWIQIGRLCESGDVVEYPFEIKGNTLTYKSSENSWIVILGIPVLAGLGYKMVKSSHDAKYGFFKGLSPVKECKNPYGAYTVQWNMKYMDPDQQTLLDRMSEIKEKYQKQAEKEYAEDEQMLSGSKGSFAWFFKQNTPIATRLKQLLEKDEEYVKLSNKVAIPDNVRLIMGLIDEAYKYLADEALISITKNKVEFLIKGTDPDNPNNLGGAQSSTFKKTYVNLYIKKPALLTENSSQGIEEKDNLLLTITHELFHICQERYHTSYWTDSNRFDEMTAVVLEADAKKYFQDEKIITSGPKLTDTNSKAGTLIHPIDADFWYTTSNRHEFMQNQGYFLSRFVQYLRQETGNEVKVWKIMSARSYIKKPTISEPLMKAFNLNETQFDKYFRSWILSMTDRVAGDFNLALNEDWFKSAGYTIDRIQMEKEKSYRVDMKANGSYSVIYRNFLIPKDKSAAVLIQMDSMASDAHPEVDIAGAYNLTRTKFGYYIKENKKLGGNTEILEIYGDQSLKKGNSGYTVWPAVGPNKPELSIKDNYLEVKLPAPVGPAKAGLVDGVVIYVEAGSDSKHTFTLEKDKLGTTVNIDLADIKPESEDYYVVTVYTKEYLYASDGSNLFLPESEAAKITVGDNTTEEQAYTGLYLTKDTLCNDYEQRERQDTNEHKYWHDPWPNNNTVRIRGNEVIVELGGLDWTVYGQDKQYEKVKMEHNYTRGPITITGHIIYNRDGLIECEITDLPATISGRESVYEVDGEMRDGKMEYTEGRYYADYVLSDYDFYHDGLELNSSGMYLRFKDGELITVTVTIKGMCKISETMTVDGKTENRDREISYHVDFKLEKQ